MVDLPATRAELSEWLAAADTAPIKILKDSTMPKTLDDVVDAMVEQAEADLIDDEGSDLEDCVDAVGFAAVALFSASLGDHAMASATVMTDDGMVRVTVTITDED